VDGQALLHCREAVDGTFARRTLVLVILGDVDEVGFAEATLCLGIGGHRFGHQRRDEGLSEAGVKFSDARRADPKLHHLKKQTPPKRGLRDHCAV
jgi:hypothetical protein